MNNSKTKSIIGTTLKGIGLAMGISVLVLNILGKIENNSSIKLLSLGVIAYGLYLLQDTQ